VIKKAPLTFISTFIILLIFTFTGFFFGFDWAYDKTFLAKDAVIQAKDATIENKDAIIQNMKTAKAAIKTYIFDGDGNKIVGIGTDKIINDFKLINIGEWDIIIIELQTKGHLEFTPSIQTITDSFSIIWDKIERIKSNTIKWTGHYSMYDADKIAQFKMEIFHKN